MLDPALSQRIDRGVRESRERAAAARLAHALRAERVVGGWHGMLMHGDGAQHPGTRHEVIREARGEQLSCALVVDSVLAKDLSCALRDAAVNLACDKGGIDDVPEIVDCGVALD